MQSYRKTCTTFIVIIVHEILIAIGIAIGMQLKFETNKYNSTTNTLVLQCLKCRINGYFILMLINIIYIH